MSFFPLEEKFVSISFQHCILGVNKSVGQQAVVSFLVFFVFLSLRASSPERSGGGAGKGRRVCNYDSTSNSPVARRLSCQISANQRGVETSANVNKHWKTRGYNLIRQSAMFSWKCKSYSVPLKPNKGKGTGET